MCVSNTLLSSTCFRRGIRENANRAIQRKAVYIEYMFNAQLIVAVLKVLLKIAGNFIRNAIAMFGCVLNGIVT